ncbi:Lrp/AsnC family transcriptional regulator [Spartinivicinus poritis]|uniref:Lrp/AsnC family transcriptional regulator n=1 Tax=Spartinivicinus poritis TaxID=2994640 RepID=A0ABT5UBW2_9GAMM|nr:Lrp/AsnC family transcriptional regulator [Spartinivicinus sp. A2-2]MDE1462987.1 Lrp/AsnC family transcriptional regulator [Spartinivicinus sp. A2-2]
MSNLKDRQPGELDQFDLAILAILQRDNTTPLRVIGEKVHLSAPAVQRRIKRLEQEGIIEANVCVVNGNKIGLPVTIITTVDMESERIDILNNTKNSFTATKEVQQCYYVAGECDFILVLTVATIADYEFLTRKLFFDNSNIKRFRTFVVMESVKASLAVPLAS